MRTFQREPAIDDTTSASIPSPARRPLDAVKFPEVTSEDRFIQAMRSYAIRALTKGHSPEEVSEFLKRAAQGGSIDELNSATEQVTQLSPWRTEWSQQVVRSHWSTTGTLAWCPRRERVACTNSEYQRVFGNRDRITIPLVDPNHSEVQQAVADALCEKGYQILDYDKGTARSLDDTQTGNCVRSIKKILDSEILRENFRRRAPADCVIVVSRDPVDIIRASTGRSWKSCLNLVDGQERDAFPRESRVGTLIAYLVRKNDPTILRPLARIRLVPYLDSTGTNTVLVPDKPIGMFKNGFVESVQRWVDESFNAGKSGTFTREAYTDGGDDVISLHSSATRQLFKALAENDTNGALKALNNGADVNARAHTEGHLNDPNPLQLASTNQNLVLVEALIKNGATLGNPRKLPESAIHMLLDAGYTNFRGQDLSATDFSGRDLRALDLSDCDLRAALFSGAQLEGANLENARFCPKSFTQAKATGRRDFRGITVISLGEDGILSGEDLSHLDLSGAYLRRIVLQGANLTGTLLKDTLFSGCDLRQAKTTHLHETDPRSFELFENKLGTIARITLTLRRFQALIAGQLPWLQSAEAQRRNIEPAAEGAALPN